MKTFVLDTNVLLFYLRGEQNIVRTFDELQLLEDDKTLAISIVSFGEMKSLAKRRKWSVGKTQNMNQWLKDFLIIPIDSEDILDAYAEIEAYSQGKLENKPLPSGFTARNMGKNDLWISATAYLLDATLITMDKDFQHLSPEFITVEDIDI